MHPHVRMDSSDRAEASFERQQSGWLGRLTGENMFIALAKELGDYLTQRRLAGMCVAMAMARLSCVCSYPIT
jgi:hypothetical protein